MDSKTNTARKLNFLAARYHDAWAREEAYAALVAAEPNTDRGNDAFRLEQHFSTLRSYIWKDMWAATEGLTKHHRAQVRKAFRANKALDQALRKAYGLSDKAVI